MNCLPIDIALDVRKLLLLKSCFESPSDLVRLCGSIRFNDYDVLDLFYKYDLQCNMSKLFIKSCVKF